VGSTTASSATIEALASADGSANIIIGGNNNIFNIGTSPQQQSEGTNLNIGLLGVKPNIVVTPGTTNLGNRSTNATYLPLLTIYNDDAEGTTPGTSVTLNSNFYINTVGNDGAAFDINGYNYYTSLSVSCNTGVTQITNPTYFFSEGLYAVMSVNPIGFDGVNTMAIYQNGGWYTGGGGSGRNNGNHICITATSNPANLSINNGGPTVNVQLAYVRLSGPNFNLMPPPP
jgi:hypothetical protein